MQYAAIISVIKAMYPMEVLERYHGTSSPHNQFRDGAERQVIKNKRVSIDVESGAQAFSPAHAGKDPNRFCAMRMNSQLKKQSSENY